MCHLFQQLIVDKLSLTTENHKNMLFYRNNHSSPAKIIGFLRFSTVYKRTSSTDSNFRKSTWKKRGEEINPKIKQKRITSTKRKKKKKKDMVFRKTPCYLWSLFHKYHQDQGSSNHESTESVFDLWEPSYTNLFLKKSFVFKKRKTLKAFRLWNLKKLIEA